MAASTVTERTSVVLVSSVGTKVYLSSVGYPGHIVTIKDYTGVASQGNPIVVSTTQNVFFQDGSISTLLYSPFSFLTVSSKTPTIWQILNNTGFLTTLSNSFVETLTTENAFLGTLSSVTDVVSTSIAQNVNVTRTLEILGNVDILGNIIVNGEVDFFSTLNVKDDISFSSGLIVNGPVSIASSLFVRDDMIIRGDVSTLNHLIVGDDLYISSILRIGQTLVPKNLSVQSLTMNMLNVLGDLQVAGNISTENLFLGDSLVTTSSFLMSNNLVIQGPTHIYADTEIRNTLTTSVLEVQSSGTVTKEVSVSSLQVNGTLSTAESLFVRGLLINDSQTIADGILVTGSVSAGGIIVGGNAEISTILTSTLAVLGDMNLVGNLITGYISGAKTEVIGNIYLSNTNVGGITSTLGDFRTLSNLFVQSNMHIRGNAYFENLSASSLGILGNVSTESLFVGNNIIVNGDFEIPGIARVGALAAPIEIKLSTLTLSNTFQATSTAKIPILLTSDSAFLQHMRIGVDIQKPFTGFLETPSMNVRGAIQNLTEVSYQTTKHIEISTIQSTSVFQLFVVGSSNYSQPLTGAPGRILLGSNSSFTISLNNTSPVFDPNPLKFSTIGYGSAYGKGIWVAVGQDGQDISTIKYSLDTGASWKQVKSGGFPVAQVGFPPFVQTYGQGKDVAYFSTTYYNGNTEGRWVAGGSDPVSMPPNSIALQQSINGIDWIQIFQPSVTPLNQVNRVFVHSFQDPVFGTVALAGGSKGFGNFGISFSHDLNNWSNCTTQHSPPVNFTCEDICEDDAKNLYAVGSTGANTLFRTDQVSYSNGWNSNVSSYLPVNLTQLKTIAYGNNIFVIGGTPAGGNPSFSLWYTIGSNMGVWQQPSLAFNAGFTGTVNRILYDSNIGNFIALGSNTGGYNLQISPNGQVWFPFSFPFASPLYSITPSNATILTQDLLTPYFIPNVETRFNSGISSLNMIISSVNASSIQGNILYGDASLITNINSFGSSLFTSSILAQEVLYNAIPDKNNTYLTIQRDVVMSTGVFQVASSYPSFSTLVVLNAYAAGADSLQRGTIQSSSNNLNWIRSANPVFEEYGNAIYGNSNFLVDPQNNTESSASGQLEPVYVATGVDSRTNHTIQYSFNATTWFPVNSGGFSIPNSDGLKIGNTVTYRAYPFRFLVGGEAQGTMSTIFYSDQGFSFTAANPSPFIMNSVKKLKANDVYNYPGNIVGLNDTNTIIYSRDGINWQGNNNYQFNAIASANFVWYGLTSNGLVYNSTNDGQDFLFLTTTNITNFGGIPLSNVIDFTFGESSPGQGVWVAITSNTVYASLMTFPFSGIEFWESRVILGATRFKSIFFDKVQSKFFLGTEDLVQENTIYYCDVTNTYNWIPIISGGFSTLTELIGTGYGVTASTSMVLAGGIGSFSAGGSAKPQIQQVSGVQFPPGPSGASASGVLSLPNSSNVFRTSVRALGIASTNAQLYPYVAVGDGIIPQKSIARSSNLTNWIPAITGGFSTGYGVMYYDNSGGTSMWLAVGAAASGAASIQYSPDGANWFATNNSGGLQGGGRAIALLSTATLTRLIAVGEAPSVTNPSLPKNTMVYSDNGFTWQKAGSNQGFAQAAYAVAAGYKSGSATVPAGECVLAGGLYENGINPNDLLFSQDGVTWTGASFNIFSKATYGIAYGNSPSVGHRWVVVGENTTPGSETIKWSSDGDNWNSIIGLNPFYYAGYGVTYNPGSNVFIAVGKATNNTTSIAYSHNGQTWNTLTSGGFSNAELLGSANGLYTQCNNVLDQNPFIQFPNFITYSRETPRTFYIDPTIRTFSTTIVLNEAMYIGFSSIAINSNAGLGDAALTVDGSIRTSTLVYKGLYPTGSIAVSSLVVSTLQVDNPNSGVANIFETPSWGWNSDSLANKISISAVGGKGGSLGLVINDAFYVSGENKPLAQGKVGINTLTPGTTVTAPLLVDVNGDVACSSFTTSVYRQEYIYFSTPDSTYIQSSNLSITTNSPQSISYNTIYSEVSSLRFNNILTIQQSTQRVGCYTTNPQFDFDAQRKGFISTLTTQRIYTNMVFLTLQSL